MWAAAIPAILQYMGSQQAAQAREKSDAKALQLNEDAYNRALQLLAEGKLEYTPELAAAIKLGPSKMEGISADPAAMAAQRDALTKLSKASEEGYGVIDRAAINAAMNEANQNERGQREAALARLTPGSGASIAARLSAQQSSANRANQQALDIAANSRRQALAALAQQGGLASSMRNQSFGEQAQIAGAQDAIEAFNARNANSMNQFNAAAGNEAKARGAQNRLGAVSGLRGTTQDYAGALYGKGQRDAETTMAPYKAIGGAGYEVFRDDDEDKK